MRNGCHVLNALHESEYYSEVLTGIRGCVHS